MTAFLLSSFVVAYILTVWFETSFFTEYAKLFDLTKWFKIEEYLAIVADGSDKTYIEFLQEYYDNFWTRLLACPVCFASWVSVPITLLAGCFLSNFGVAFLGLTLYYMFLVLRKYAK